MFNIILPEYLSSLFGRINTVHIKLVVFLAQTQHTPKIFVRVEVGALGM